MTTKQSARLHRKTVNRDCFVEFPTLHHLSALLAMTHSWLFNSPVIVANLDGCSHSLQRNIRFNRPRSPFPPASQQ